MAKSWKYLGGGWKVDMQGILSLFNSRFFPCPAEMSGYARKYINYPDHIRHKKQPLETGKLTLLILKRLSFVNVTPSLW